MSREEEIAAIEAAVKAGKVKRYRMGETTENMSHRMDSGKKGLALKRKRQAAQRKSIVSRAENRRRKAQEGQG